MKYFQAMRYAQGQSLALTFKNNQKNIKEVTNKKTSQHHSIIKGLQALQYDCIMLAG